MNDLQYKLFELESKHKKNATAPSKHLRVFYGWAKLGKVRKKEAISVIFENERQREERTLRAIAKYQHTVYVREQTAQEMQGAEGIIRVFTEYSIYLSDRHINGSLTMALKANSDADKNHISLKVRNEIEAALRSHYLLTHKDYHEPVTQLFLEFENEN